MRCDVREFFGWAIYQNLFGPFGEERADARAAIMPWLYATAHTQKGQPKPKVDQFIPHYRGSRPHRTPEEIEADCFRWLKNRNTIMRRQRGVLASPEQP